MATRDDVTVGCTPHPTAAATSALVGNLLAGTPRTGMWAQGTGTVSWAGLRAQVDDLEKRFALAGIGPGATVSVRMQPSFTLVWTVLALWTRGAAVVLVDTADPLGRCEATHHVRSGGFGPGLTKFVDECEVVVTQRPPTTPEAAAGAATGACLMLTADDDIEGCIGYGNGATGNRRCYGPAALRAKLDQLARRRDLAGCGERSLLIGSLTRDPWWTLGVLHPIAAGATLVLPGRDGFPAGEPVDVILGPAASLILGTLNAGGLRTVTAAGDPAWLAA